MDPKARFLMLGFGGGVAAVVGLPIVAPLFAETARSLVKALLKGTLLGIDYLHTHAAHFSEVAEDLVAEATAEVRAELDRRAEAGTAQAVEVAHARGNGRGARAPNARPGPKSVS